MEEKEVFTEEEKRQHKKNLEHWTYQRVLELIAVISEEWGEAVKEANNLLWKNESMNENEWNNQIAKILKELKQLDSPVQEFRNLLMKITVRKVFLKEALDND